MNSVSYHAHPCSMICHRIPPWIIFIKLKVLVRWKNQIHDVQKKKPMTDYWSSHLNLIYTSHTHIHIYIYLLLGEAWGSPEHRGTFNLAIQLYMSDLLLIYRRVGRCGINVLWTGLEPRCCYVEDVEDVARLKYVYVEDVEHVARLKTLKTLKMLLGWSVFTLKMLNMLLCWRRCYVEDAATLKMFSRWRCWRCCYVEMLLCVHFAHASLGNYDIFMGSMRTLKFYQHAILLVSTETT